ncbi:MAG: hypothetical protein HUU20_04270 [Pirellulales bacterium]|nr:hypothetical protein [Pirellulales bacterium]
MMKSESDRVNPPAEPSTPLGQTPDFFTAEHLDRRRRAMAQYAGWQGADDLDPKTPAGHAYGVRVSSRLSGEFKRTHRKLAMDISPQDVIDVLKAAGVKNWALMGLHGYVGYLPSPRATQDVDVMVPYRQRQRAVKAIRRAWPELVLRELSQVVRFLDPQDRDAAGRPKPVIDLMLPGAKFQQTILDEYIVIDEPTGHSIPRLEAALVCKYAAMISPHRDPDKRGYDCADFRVMVRANEKAIHRDDLRRLAGQVWEGGPEEIERFLEIALGNRPFPL